MSVRTGLVLVVLVLLCCCPLQARKKTNCGLSCYRYTKCMGYLDGGNRPGQLGDTGIIVLGHCKPLAKGCDCELDLDSILKKDDNNEDSTESGGLLDSSDEQVESKLYLEKTTRKPRTINRNLYERKRFFRF